MEAEEIIERLGLQRHPEGGHYRETWRDRSSPSGRGAGTAIYHLLAAGETSRWHRLDATEIWHFYAGDALELSLYREGRAVEHQVLGPALSEGQRPQIRVPAQCWQSARTLGRWTLVGCTVSPAFEFEHFELAPEGWKPPSGT